MFYFEYILREWVYILHAFILQRSDMAILKCLRDYVVADNDVTIAGRALHYNATVAMLSLATSCLLFE